MSFEVFKSLQNMDSRLGFGVDICSSPELSVCLMFILCFEWADVCSSLELSVNAYYTRLCLFGSRTFDLRVCLV